MDTAKTFCDYWSAIRWVGVDGVVLEISTMRSQPCADGAAKEEPIKS
jgi:hypothetical protein